MLIDSHGVTEDAGDGAKIPIVQTKGEERRIMDESKLSWFVEWFWVPLLPLMAEGLRRVVNLFFRVSFLEKELEQRAEDHKETMQALRDHNDAVLTTVTSISDRVASNGRRLGVIESHLINNNNRSPS